jgi:hypothetical protein
MFSKDEISQVIADEIGEYTPGASRLTVNESSKEHTGEGAHVERAPVFHRPQYATGYQPPTRCPHFFSDGRQCTFTSALCPGHKEKSAAEFIFGESQ